MVLKKGRIVSKRLSNHRFGTEEVQNPDAVVFCRPVGTGCQRWVIFGLLSIDDYRRLGVFSSLLDGPLVPSVPSEVLGARMS